MLIVDSAYMEELPAPQFMHQSFLHHPDVRESLDQHHHDQDRYEYSDEDESEWRTEPHQYRSEESRDYPDLHTLLRQSLDSPHEDDFSSAYHEHQEPTEDYSEHHRDVEFHSSAGQLHDQPHDTYDIDNYYHVQHDQQQHHEQRDYYGEHDGYANDASLKDQLSRELAKEGGKHLTSTLGMHFGKESKDIGKHDT